MTTQQDKIDTHDSNHSNSDKVIHLDPQNQEEGLSSKEEKYKEEQKKRIAQYVTGGIDIGGNKIEKIYSRGDEYVIYEVSNLPPHESMLVYIDSINEDDMSMIARYHLAKESFDSFISHCYKYNCSSIYKKRAATVMSAVMLGINTEPKKSFDTINNDIKYDYDNTVTGRNLYQFGAITLSIIIIFLAMLTYLNRESDFIKSNHFISIVLYAASFASMGGFISVSLKIRALHTDRELKKRTYFFYGAERILFSVIAGVLVYFMLKGNIIFGFLNTNSDISFSLYVVCALSGFSETLIPNTLRNLETKAGK